MEGKFELELLLQNNIENLWTYVLQIFDILILRVLVISTKKIPRVFCKIYKFINNLLTIQIFPPLEVVIFQPYGQRSVFSYLSEAQIRPALYRFALRVY